MAASYPHPFAGKAVIPAQAGIHPHACPRASEGRRRNQVQPWMPACAGMTRHSHAYPWAFPREAGETGGELGFPPVFYKLKEGHLERFL